MRKVIRLIIALIISPIAVPIFLFVWIVGMAVFWLEKEDIKDAWEIRPGIDYFKWLMFKEVN